MRQSKLALLICLILFVTSLGGGVTAGSEGTDGDKGGVALQKTLLVGKWGSLDPAVKDLNMTVEFTKDKKLRMTAGQLSMNGIYRWLDEKHIEVEMTFLGKTQKQKLQVLVSKTELKTTDEAGKTDTFQRVK